MNYCQAKSPLELPEFLFNMNVQLDSPKFHLSHLFLIIHQITIWILIVFQMLAISHQFYYSWTWLTCLLPLSTLLRTFLNTVGSQMGYYSELLETSVQVDLNLLFNTIIQESANCCLWDEFNMPSVFVKKVYQNPCHTHSFMYMSLLSC